MSDKDKESRIKISDEKYKKSYDKRKYDGSEELEETEE
jgi:hypothetical protein